MILDDALLAVAREAEAHRAENSRSFEYSINI